MNEKMNSIEWYKVGWVRDAHGIKGEIYVQLLSKKAQWLAEMSYFKLVPMAGLKMPPQVFKFKRVKPHKLGLIIMPEGFTTRNQSEEWKGADFLIDKKIFQTKEGETPYLVEFEGFDVWDAHLGKVGVIQSFQDNGAHDLLVVETTDKREVLIPFVDAFIREIKKQDRRIDMDLPEGLLDED